MLWKAILIHCVCIISDTSAKIFIKPQSNQQQYDHQQPNSGPEARFITKYPLPQKHAETVHYEYKYLPENGYSLYYETTDGQMRYEYGYFKDDENFKKILNVRGFYGFYDDIGKRHFIRYSANEKGFLYQSGKPFFDSSQGPPTVENTLFGDFVK